VVAQIVARDGSGWRKIWRGETVFAWNALLIMLGLILLVARAALCAFRRNTTSSVPTRWARMCCIKY
jgi:hypothetical protein